MGTGQVVSACSRKDAGKLAEYTSKLITSVIMVCMVMNEQLAGSICPCHTTAKHYHN